MKFSLSALLLAVIAALVAGTIPATAAAQTAGKGAPASPMDCSKWKDGARCESLNRKVKACRDKIDDAWLDCMGFSAPAAKFTPPKPRDCSKASNKEGCEAHTRALYACKSKTTRAEHRQCMAEQPSRDAKS